VTGHVYQQKLEKVTDSQQELTFRLSAVNDTLVFMMMSTRTLISPGVVYP